MEARILLSADFANIDSSGKLNIIGAFNRIYAHEFPAIHPLMHLVIRLTAELGELDRQRTLTILIWDEDGKQVGELPSIPFSVKSPKGGKRGDHNAILQLQGMTFEKPGTYEFKVLVDGDLKGIIPIELILLPKPDDSE